MARRPKMARYTPHFEPSDEYVERLRRLHADNRIRHSAIPAISSHSHPYQYPESAVRVECCGCVEDGPPVFEVKT